MSGTQLQVCNLLSPRAVHTAILQPTGSKVFMKRLIPVTIATILHRRTNFDATTYNTHQFNGIEYSTFSSKNNTAIKEIRRWIKCAVDAFEKNYLHELYMVFTKTDAPTDVIESYKFKFHYFPDCEKSTIPCDNLEESTNSLLQSINILKMCELLHIDQFSVGFILTCNEGVSPSEYKSPFYRDDATTTSILNGISNGVNTFIPLGHISTFFHSMNCHSKGSLLLSTNFGDNCTRTLDEELDSIFHVTDNDMQVGEAEQSNTSLPINNTSFDNTIISITSKDLQCLCKLNEKFTNIGLIECYNCNSFNHAPCLGFLYSSTAMFLCDACQDIPLLSLEKSKVKQEKCTYQLAVAYAYFNGTVPFDVLNCSPSKNSILKKLVMLKVLTRNGSECSLDMSQLKTVISNTFQDEITCSLSSSSVEENNNGSIILNRN